MVSMQQPTPFFRRRFKTRGHRRADTNKHQQASCDFIFGSEIRSGRRKNEASNEGRRRGKQNNEVKVVSSYPRPRKHQARTMIPSLSGRTVLPRLAAASAAVPASSSGAGLASFSTTSSASASASASGTPQPNRMTAAFNEMKRSCPDEMAAYADCVVRGHRDGNLEKGACQAEFDLVKACFRSARALQQ